MKFQVMLLALPAIAAARACPAKKHRTSSTASILSPEASSTFSIAVAPTASVVPESSSTAPVFVSESSSTASVVASESSSKASVVVSAASTKAAVAAATSSSSSSSSSSSLSSSSDAVSGKSTFYGGNLSGGTCSFTTLSKIPSGLYGTAFSGSAWDNAAECGACLKVTGPNGNSITVMVSIRPPPLPSRPPSEHTIEPESQVVDECPECDEGHLDLFEDAYEALGSTSAGEIATSYTKVACGISSPIVLHNKSGTSAYWFSMQVVNSNEPISTLEVSTDGGSTWQSTTRTEYNFFENSSGFGTDTVDVRVTSTSGGTITVSDVSVAANAQVTASSNFS